jgi:LacI family transcriptional regulator
LSVTGFDNIALSRELRPTLTTMWVDTTSIGRQAAHTLLGMLGGEQPASSTRIEPRLCVRESTGPRRRD